MSIPETSDKNRDSIDLHPFTPKKSPSSQKEGQPALIGAFLF
jgi:hypothetical protein